jgi:hypothetical protein
MNMKKIVFFLAVTLSLILLLGSNGSKRNFRDPKCQWEPGARRQNIDEYTIVHDPNLNKLQENVRKKLDDSWQPIGGISFVKNEYYQVMIK